MSSRHHTVNIQSAGFVLSVLRSLQEELRPEGETTSRPKMRVVRTPWVTSEHSLYEFRMTETHEREQAPPLEPRSPFDV